MEDDVTLPKSPIRVLLANLPELLAQVISQAVVSQPDIEVVGHTRDNWELLRMASGIDVVILGAAVIDPPPGICSHLFSELPDIKILVIDPTGTSAMSYWLAVYRSEAVVASSSELVIQIRTLSNVNSMA